MGKTRKRRKAKGKQPAGLGPRFVLFSDGPVPQEGFCDIDPHQGAFEGPIISEESFQTDSPPHFVASIQKKQAVPKKKNHEPPEVKKSVRPQKANVQPPECGSEPGLHPLHDEAHHLDHPDFENRPPGFARPEFECGPGPVPLFRPPFDDGPIPRFHPQLANGPGRGFQPPPFGEGPDPDFRPQFDDVPRPGFRPPFDDRLERGFHPPPLDDGPRFHPPLDDGPRFHPPLDDGPRFHPPPLNDGPRFHPPPLNAGPRFHPPPLNAGPRFHPPPLDDGPRFHPPPFDDGPRFHPPPLDDGPRFHPPPFDDGPRFHPPPFDDGPRFHPAPFHDGPGPGPGHGRGFHPGPFDVRPGPRPGVHPGEFDDGRPGFVSTKFQGGPCYPGMEPGRDPMEGYGAQDIKLKSLLDIRVDPLFGARKGLHAAPQDILPPGPRPLMGLEVPPLAPSAPSRKGGQQGPKQAMNESGTTAAPKASTSSINSASDFKPPPGRSIGVISFVGNNYGFIDREDLKKFSFSFDAFLGNVANLIIGVKVHFTAVKEQGNEIATDVKVAPRGTEKIGDMVYEGVVIKVIPETYVMEPYPGCIRTILSTETVKLSFGKADARATLLMFDRVKFQLLTDIITKRNRATNITPQMPETFQLTKEIREKGLLMNVKDNTLFIMSKQHENLTASFSENLSDTDLNIMDEVEFTVLKVKDTTKAIRLKKLPEGSLVPKEQNTVLLGSKLEPLTSEVAAKEEVEDVSSEKYEGTVFEIISKTSSKDEKQREQLDTAQGLVDCVVEGTKKRLPFRSGDVVTQATMMVGDKVQFNIATKQRTKEERAVGIEIHPDTFHTETTEQRKIGVVMKLDDNSGFIRTPQYPQLFFYVKEVMEDTRLTLSEKVEFTLAVNKEVEEGKCAVRIRRLKESIFTSVPKLERLGEKEKKKMTIKLLMDPKEKIKYEQNTEGQKGDLKEDSKQPPKSPNEEMKAKIQKIKVEREESSSRDSSRRRSRSRDRDGSHYRRHRSSSRERSRYRQSRSRDRSHRSKHTCSRSRSRSPSRSGDRSSRSNRRRSHSPDKRHGRREHSSKSDRRISRSPCRKSDGSKSTTTKSGSTEADAVLYEIEKKKRELLELNELIARKRAIIAMEQGAGSLKGGLEMEGQQGIATFDYQHKTCLESAWMGDVKPVKSILKKPSESPVSPQFQPKVSSQDMIRYPNPVSHTSDWNQQSSSPQTEDQELARKKKQLDDLNESIARKRAIMAMKQKAKGDLGGPPSKKEYDLAGDVDTTEPNEDEWQLSIKPDLQPKKSILKKRSEGLSDQLKLDMAAHQYGYDHPSFSITNDPEDLSLPFLEKSGTSPSVPLPSQRSSSTSKFYNQKNARESKSEFPYEGVPHAQSGQFTSLTQERTSVSKETSKPPSQQQQELTTQMQRFLSALNKADSKLLSTMLREAKTDSESRKTEEQLPAQADLEASHKDELYDPFEGTDDHEDDSPYRDRIPGLGRSEDRLDDDLLPHERAVEDGSGFSRIVGLNYSSDAKAESRFAYRETGAPNSQSRFTEQCDGYKMSQDSFSEGSYFEHPSRSVDGYQNPYLRVQDSHAGDSEQYERQKDAEQYSVQASFSQGKEKAGEREASDDSKKAENFEKLQNLLQTIGLNLDSAEFTKLADRTRERLYGKKAKSPSRLTKSDERSVSQYDRRGSSGRAGSSESEGVRSVSPARSSNREVYMSYSDSLRHRGRRDEGSAGAEQENPVNLKRTISNSPEGSQAIPKQPLTTADRDLYPQSAPAQFISSVYAQESTQAPLGAPYFPTTPDSLGPGLPKGLTGSSQISVSPYAAVSPGPLFFAAGHQAPAGFGTFGPTVGPSPVLPSALNMPHPPLPFSTQIPFHTPHLPFPAPVPAAQLSMSGEPGASTSAATWGMKKQVAQTRCLKEILPALKKIAVKKARRSRGKNKPGKNPKQQVGAGVVPKQVTAITEEDIKAKQKKRLEKFNQRMKLKKEQQMEAQRNQHQSQNSKPGKAIQNQVKNVWVCGHSLVFWAEKRATSPEIGMQLGMDPQSVKIWWKGVQGLTWEQFLPLLLQLKDNWPKPDVILMHLGGNDLGKTTAEAFLAAVKNDLISMKNIFPHCLLVWSDILPRRWWRHSEDCEEVDRVCKIINQGVHHILAELGGSSLTHENIMAGLDSGLYRPDGVHLSGRGIDTFNLNMQDFLEKWESEFEAPELSGV